MQNCQKGISTCVLMQTGLFNRLLPKTPNNSTHVSSYHQSPQSPTCRLELYESSPLMLASCEPRPTCPPLHPRWATLRRLSSLATSAQLFIGCSEGGLAVEFASLASEARSDFSVRGDDMTEAVIESTGLAGADGVDGVDGRPCVATEVRLALGDDGLAGSSVHCFSGLTSPDIGVRWSCGLLFDGVGTVSILCREKTDDAILLSVRLWSRLRTGVLLRLPGVTGRGSFEPEPRDRS